MHQPIRPQSIVYYIYKKNGWLLMFFQSLYKSSKNDVMIFNNIETLCMLKLINPFQAYVPFL